MAPVQFYIDQWTPLPAKLTGTQLAGKIVIVTGATSGASIHHRRGCCCASSLT